MLGGMAGRWVAWVLLTALAAMFSGCASRSVNHAPVEDRGAVVSSGPLPAPAPIVLTPRLVPGAEPGAKAGYYTVKPGDTLIRIALDHGQAVRDLALWNALDNPNRIEVGQVLRIEPPNGVALSRPVPLASVTPVATPGARPNPSAPAPVSSASGSSAAVPVPAPAPVRPASSATTAGVSAVAAPASSSSAAALPVVAPEEEVNWLWPGSGVVLATFDEAKNKGLDLAGAAGDPVLAAADGRVVYVGAGLRGYGNLVILKHNSTYLTAYAHNQALLVKEDQNVRRGQKIAEMGSSDTDRVKLHFELRRQGKPVDPLRYLPAR